MDKTKQIVVESVIRAHYFQSPVPWACISIVTEENTWPRISQEIDLRNMRTRHVIDRTFDESDHLDEPEMETRPHQFLYEDKSGYVFMDAETFDQITVRTDQPGNCGNAQVQGPSHTSQSHDYRRCHEQPNRLRTERAITRRPAERRDAPTGTGSPPLGACSLLDRRSVHRQPLDPCSGRDRGNQANFP